KAISIEPMNFIYLANYADLLRVNAVEYYQKALKLNPTHPVTNSNYAYLLHMYLKQTKRSIASACQEQEQPNATMNHIESVGSEEFGEVEMQQVLDEMEMAIWTTKMSFQMNNKRNCRCLAMAKSPILFIPEFEKKNSVDDTRVASPNTSWTVKEVPAIAKVVEMLDR
ncbi:hypothetical protein RFI_36432, partial [Reticulomyxa filosa]